MIEEIVSRASVSDCHASHGSLTAATSLGGSPFLGHVPDPSRTCPVGDFLGDCSPFCYVAHPESCPTDQPSEAYPGAGWADCELPDGELDPRRCNAQRAD